MSFDLVNKRVVVSIHVEICSGVRVTGYVAMATLLTPTGLPCPSPKEHLLHVAILAPGVEFGSVCEAPVCTRWAVVNWTV